MSGYTSYRAGLAAEDGVAELYERRGCSVTARRWRSAAGEIDLIARQGDMVIFVEVKRARDFASAAARLGTRQIARLLQAAEIFLGGEPEGAGTEARFDMALVDGAGRVEILENALVP